MTTQKPLGKEFERLGLEIVTAPSNVVARMIASFARPTLLIELGVIRRTISPWSLRLR